ncbi:LOW QUALITY PROTEIN: regulator of G-protein signaling 14 [Microcaecilia unicolor]|uniref:LOW QUALITY PROTEIN: regulator of G-protein signaling 14 n=1 Tax=Microcaecilia unicolor TaxID=1415580 RepID=A0A6P7YWG6_9AMPH|nr:LOW QUALITY PROTEIN: regulator of G-protein signaling 14 [Microcaecilia unicolor]
MKSLGVSKGRMVLTASDGDLNSLEVDGRGSDQSLNSLPSVQTRAFSAERSVASWAVSFERLLQDPIGVKYFTEFLRKEFSVENISFWEACQRFQQISPDDSEQLLQECHRIYNVFLSSSSCSPVNIDFQASLSEEWLRTPTPDMFRNQQLQVFNLMKFDSYSRFVKSQLYLECMLAEVEGRPLPDLSVFPTNSTIDTCTPSDFSKKKLKSARSLPVGTKEAGAETLKGSRSAKPFRRSFKKRERREMWTDVSEGENLLSPRRESQGSLSSATSVDLGFLSSVTNKCENDGVQSETESKTIRYCCIYLPDGTASLTAVRPGLTIREMLLGICRKRGLSLADVKVHLVGNKQFSQKTLVLDQDSMVLADQEVKLENRVSFELEIYPIKKMVRITAKSTKSLRQAVQPAVGEYELNMSQVLLRRSGETTELNLDMPVSAVATQQLILDTKSESEMDDICSTDERAIQQHSQRGYSPGSHEETDKPETGRDEYLSDISANARNRVVTHMKNLSHRQTSDVEGLVELLNRVQSCCADDQRGLLSKENLVLPDFLQLPDQIQCGDENSEIEQANELSLLSPSAPTKSMNPPSSCLCSSLMPVDQCMHDITAAKAFPLPAVRAVAQLHLGSLKKISDTMERFELEGFPTMPWQNPKLVLEDLQKPGE